MPVINGNLEDLVGAPVANAELIFTSNTRATNDALALASPVYVYSGQSGQFSTRPLLAGVYSLSVKWGGFTGPNTRLYSAKFALTVPDEAGPLDILPLLNLTSAPPVTAGYSKAQVDGLIAGVEETIEELDTDTYSKTETDARLARVNVLDFGADPTGATDSTAAIAAAYASLSATDGGELFFPVGEWKFNLVINKPNVTITGSSHIVDFTGTMRSRFIPADTTLPVIQVGNDSAFVKGFLMQRVTIDGQNLGLTGLYLAGGGVEATIRNVTVVYCKVCVKVLGGAAYPDSLVWFDRVDTQPSNVTGARGWLITQTATYPTSWTTAIYIVNCHGAGPAASVSNGYAFEVDSCGVYLANTYFDVHDDHGFKISKTYAQQPFLYCSLFALDSVPGTGAALESFSNNRYFVDQISGGFSISGKWKLLDGTLLTPPQGAMRQNATFLYPQVHGSLNLIELNDTGFTGQNDQRHRLNISSGNLFVITEGSIKFDSELGVYQIEGEPTAGASQLKYFDPFNNKTALVQGLNGSMNHRPAAGAATRLQSSDGAITGLQVNGTGGGVFFLGLTANTLLYLDSNKQLKSIAPTITAPGTTGAQTINAPSGRVNFAAAAQTLVVTNNLVATGSTIFATVKSDDATAISVKVSAQSSGSFTLKLNAAATAETAVDFLVVN